MEVEVIQFELFNDVEVMTDAELSKAVSDSIQKNIPTNASTIKPKWYTKEHPLNRCPGVIDFINKGWLVTSHKYIFDNDDSLQYFDPVTSVGLPFMNNHAKRVCKFNTPWRIVSDKKTKVIFLDSSYHKKTNSNISIISGILNLKPNESQQINVLFSIDEDWLIKQSDTGKPLFEPKEVLMHMIEL